MIIFVARGPYAGNLDTLVYPVAPKGNLLIFSPYTADNHRVIFFTQNHTTLSIFQPKKRGISQVLFQNLASLGFSFRYY